MKISSFYLIPPNEWKFLEHGDVRKQKKKAEKYFEKNDSYQGAEYINEEFVRQWGLRELSESYGYPVEWQGERIRVEHKVKMGSGSKKSDIALLNINERPFIFVEAKTYDCSEDDWKDGIDQLESYLSATHTATIGMVTNGKKTRVIRKKIDPNDFDFINDIDAYNAPSKTSIMLTREAPALSDKTLTGLTPLSEELEGIIHSMHNIIRDTDGLHDDEALDELCKVIYAKIYDERQTVASSNETTSFRFQVFGSSGPSEAASNIRELYSEAVKYDLEMYSQRIPNYQRSRGVFQSSILKLSDPALFLVTEKIQEYSLVDSAVDLKGRAFQKVIKSAIRSGMGQYFTPDEIVDLAVRIIQPKVNERILDPFCGSGHFLSKALGYVLSTREGEITPHQLHEYKFFHLHGIELSDRMVRIAMTDMMLHDDGHTNIRNTSSLLSMDNYPDILAIQEDGNSNPEVFDIILTNPPFGKLAREEAKGMLGRFKLTDGKKKKIPYELLGLERSFQFLKPGGKMAIVMPESFANVKSHKFAREWVEEIADIKAIISLPEEAFRPFGATVNTCLCIFQKRSVPDYLNMTVSELKKLASELDIPGRSKLNNKEKLIGAIKSTSGPIEVQNDQACLLVEMENLGYDATGRYKSGSEIDEVIDLFHAEVGWE